MARCPSCGAHTATIFDHLDLDCDSDNPGPDTEDDVDGDRSPVDRTDGNGYARRPPVMPWPVDAGGEPNYSELARGDYADDYDPDR